MSEEKTEDAKSAETLEDIVDIAEEEGGETESTEKPAEKSADDSEETSPADIVPESYEITAPEGMDVDKAAMDVFTPIAKELGLTNEKAQKFADVYANIRLNEAKVQQDAFDSQQDGFIEAAKTDKEFGGVNFDKNIASANSVLTKFGGDALIEVLDSAGLANHPDVIRCFYRMSKAISEDTFVSGAKNTTPKGLAETIFDKSLKGN